MKAVWCDTTLIDSPYYFCLCLSEKQYHKELKRLKVPKDMWGEFTIKGKGATLHQFSMESGNNIAFVCINEGKGRTLFQTHALLVHEAVHLWQSVKEFIGETEPSPEFEAYSVQAISQRLFYAYDKLKNEGKK